MSGWFFFFCLEGRDNFFTIKTSESREIMMIRFENVRQESWMLVSYIPKDPGMS